MNCVHYVMRGMYFDDKLCNNNDYCGVPNLSKILNFDFSDCQDDPAEVDITETASGVHVIKDPKGKYVIIGRIIGKAAGAGGFPKMVNSHQRLPSGTNRKIRAVFNRLGIKSYFTGGRPECGPDAFIFTHWY